MKHSAALIGCGRIGFLLEADPLRYKPCTHFGGASGAGIRFTCACDINEDRLDIFGKTAGIERENLHTDYKELLLKHKPALVVISTWTDTHAEIGIAAAENGARVIVMEKPVSHSLKSASQLIRACERNHVSLIVNHERRFDARYRKAKDLIESGIIGDIKSGRGQMLTAGYRGQSNPSEGGGPLLHDGTHLIDIIRFFLGNIASLSGEFTRESRRSGFEDRASAWLKSDTGVDIFVEAGGNRRYFVFELEISGTEGKIIIGNGYEKLFLRKKSKLYTGFFDLSETKFPKFKKNNCFIDLYREAKSALNSRAVPTTSTGEDGYRSLEIIHAIYLSSSLGGKRIDLPVNPGKINISKIFDLK